MKSSGGSPGRELQVLHSLAPGSLEGGCCVADHPQRALDRTPDCSRTVAHDRPLLRTGGNPS